MVNWCAVRVVQRRMLDNVRNRFGQHENDVGRVLEKGALDGGNSGQGCAIRELRGEGAEADIFYIFADAI